VGYSVRIDKESCLSSGRCVRAAPVAFGLDADHLAEVLPGAAALSDERILEIARGCPVFAVLVFDADGDEVDV
jgi:ferredoxin